MRNDSSALLEWRLQVRFFGSLESALFTSRQEALEHAQALLDDYDRSVGIELIDPWDKKEVLREPLFIARDRTGSVDSASKYHQ